MENKAEKIAMRGEIKLFIRHSLSTAVSTAVGLLLRYLIMAHLGTYTVGVFGRSMTFTVTDNTAYFVYYVTGVVLLYLIKWFTADGVRGRSFVPRFLAFCALYVVSMLCGNGILKLCTDRFGINGELSFWLTCPVTFLINFLGSRLIVFADSENRLSRKLSGKKSDSEEDMTDGGKE